MTFTDRIAIVFMVIGMGFVGLFLGERTTRAQQQDVEPYRVFTVKTTSGYDVDVYKAVYQGCEMFVARAWESPSIVLGRGCK